MRLIALFAVAGLLAACSPEAAGCGDAVPPADAPPPAEAPGQPQPTTATDPAEPFKQDFVLMGTEPGWRIDISGQGLAFTSQNDPPLNAANTTLAATSGKATWTAEAGDKTIVAVVTAGQCSDGMSDRSYPYVAEVKIAAATYKGCGISAADLAAQPAP